MFLFFTFFFVLCVEKISFYNREISFDAISLGFLELKNEFEPINIDVQLPTRIRTKSDESIDCSKTFLRYLVSSSLQKHHDDSIVVQKNRKRSTQIIGKRGSGENEFLHPSSLAFSARDELICERKLIDCPFLHLTFSSRSL